MDSLALALSATQADSALSASMASLASSALSASSASFLAKSASLDLLASLASLALLASSVLLASASMASFASAFLLPTSDLKSKENHLEVIYLWGWVGCGVWGEYFLLSLDSTQSFSSLEIHFKMQHNYFSAGFHKWPNTLSWGCVRIFLHGYLYAVTQHLLKRRKFLFLNSLKGFWRSLADISYFHFVDNSNHLKDLVIRILWTWWCPYPMLRRWSSQWFSHAVYSKWGVPIWTIRWWRN